MSTRSVISGANVADAIGGGRTLQLEFLGGTVKPRHMVQLWVANRPEVHSHQYNVHNNDINTAERALLERVFFVQSENTFEPCPQPAIDAFRILLRTEKAFLTRKLRASAPGFRKLSTQEFCDGYRGGKRDMYIRAASSLTSRPVERSDSYISAFVKAEKIDFEGRDPAPRIIQPRSPRYNVEVGRYIRPLEKRICKILGQLFGETTVFKGLNAVEQGELMRRKWERFNDPVAIGLDAHRFDQHVSEDALRWEHSIYRAAFPGDPELPRLLDWQTSARGFVRCPDGVIRYSVRGTRASGDMNTGLGNCLLMCAMVHSYISHIGLTIADVALANNGDDCVVILERRHLELFRGRLDRFFKMLGFDMAVEPHVDELEAIEFCQAHPVVTDKHTVMVRNPHTTISKDLCTVKRDWCDKPGSYQVLRRAIGDAGCALAGDIPVYSSFYRMMRRGAETATTKRGEHSLDILGQQTGFQMLAKGLSERSGVSEHSRYSFWKAFAIPPDQQVALEEWFDKQRPVWSEAVPVRRFSSRF